MEPLEIDGSVSAVDSDDEILDEESTVEASLEILYGTECDDDTNAIKEKIIDTINETLYENNVSVDVVERLDESSDEDETDEKLEAEENIDELEIKIQNSIVYLSEELSKAAEVIKEEKECIEKELLCYKELREVFDKMGKDYEHTPVIKPRLYNQDISKHVRQMENIRPIISTANLPIKCSIEFPTSDYNPWLYSKCLLDAEKFCDQQMERVRKCISVSSINSHAADAVSKCPPPCVAEPSLDIRRHVAGDSSERHDSVGSNRNTLSWRQQSLNSKGMDKRFMGSLEKGDGYDENSSRCIHLTTGGKIE